MEHILFESNAHFACCGSTTTIFNHSKVINSFVQTGWFPSQCNKNIASYPRIRINWNIRLKTQNMLLTGWSLYTGLPFVFRHRLWQKYSLWYLHKKQMHSPSFPNLLPCKQQKCEQLWKFQAKVDKCTKTTEDIQRFDRDAVKRHTPCLL